MYTIGPFRVDEPQYSASATSSQKTLVDLDAPQDHHANFYPTEGHDAPCTSMPYLLLPEVDAALAPKKPRLTSEDNIRLKHALSQLTTSGPKPTMLPRVYDSAANIEPPRRPLDTSAAAAMADTLRWTRNGVAIQSDLKLFNALTFGSVDTDEKHLFSAEVSGKMFKNGPLKFFDLASAKHLNQATHVYDAPMRLPIEGWHVMCSTRQAVQLAFDRERDNEKNLTEVTVESLTVAAPVQMVKRLIHLQPFPSHAVFEGTINGRDISCNIQQLQRLIGPLVAGQALDASWVSAKIGGNALQAPGHLVRELLKAPPARV